MAHRWDADHGTRRSRRCRKYSSRGRGDAIGATGTRHRREAGAGLRTATRNIVWNMAVHKGLKAVLLMRVRVPVPAGYHVHEAVRPEISVQAIVDGASSIACAECDARRVPASAWIDAINRPKRQRGVVTMARLHDRYRPACGGRGRLPGRAWRPSPCRPCVLP